MKPYNYLILTLFLLLSFNLSFGDTPRSNGPTKYIDELDLSATECGWQTTQARKSVGGNPISIAGKKFARGVGHHPPGLMTVLVPPIPARFIAEVGIDDETDGQGHAEFLVYGDGKLLWRSGFMVGKQEPKLCDISLERISKLVLKVDEGPEGYGHDHTDWADARIVLDGEREHLSGIQIVRSTGNPMDDDGNEIDRRDETTCEFVSLNRELRKGISEKAASQALRSEATFFKTDRDAADVVLRRTRSLLKHLKSLYPDLALAEEEKTLDKLDARNRELDPVEIAARKSLFAEAVGVRKTIALKNPLLDFNDILFIKRHFNPEPETQGNHMCDQFFGFHARPGGGVFVLQNAFSENSSVRNVLEQSEIVNGRHHGVKLDETWGFLAPELSFDATKILFAATDTKSPRHSYTWTDDNTYSIFETPLYGGPIRQLTDGPFNDIDPCYLPGGRIAFISERRGGYGRCHGRPVPSYTLHSMNPDGSDLIMLSPHETNEWKPSVDNSGMIVYTRWDYVDRGHSQAHHPWTTTPDGRDSRSLHGNFSPVMESRPQLEATIRAIPNSQKLIATASMHHGQYFGSLLLIDPNVVDDDAMSQARRITPEQLFPEVENAAHRDPANYGQPFPISEDFYLCVYDPFSGMGKGPTNNYGIYLLDSFGNRVLLYRDPAISCQCPIPVQSRPVPPVIPNKTLIGLPLVEGETVDPIACEDLPKYGVVGLTNVYQSLHQFPAGTKIKELRIVQLLPKTTPYANVPLIGYGSQKGARAILGTVPVEEDGSAYFQLPVDIPVYFQAIDQNGLAIETMRSATYVKPGEELFCQGCHEGRHRGGLSPTSVPIAFRREPSVIHADVEGTKPFSYPRLVQPVLDKHCVDCHETGAKEGKTFTLGRGDANAHFYDSFNNLRPYVFYYDNETFTEAKSYPGKFGSYASQLRTILEAGHYDVKLTPEEMHRLTVWMDNNGDFYGSYENLQPQRNGEIVSPTLE